jgi:hypothetical protein
MLAIPVIEGEPPEETTARVKAAIAAFDAAVDKIIDGLDPADASVVRALVARGMAEHIPSFDARLWHLEAAFSMLFFAVQQLRPERVEEWSKRNQQIAEMTMAMTTEAIKQHGDKSHGSKAVH